MSANGVTTYQITPPAGTSWINNITPFYTNSGKTLNLVVEWWAGTSPSFGQPAPVQILQYSATTGSFFDDTANIISGTVPNLYDPVYADVVDLNGDGTPDLVLSSEGSDTSPYPGALTTLLLSTPSGQFVNATSNLSQYSANSHMATSGVINSSGQIGVILGNAYSQAGNTDEYFLSNGNGTFTNVSSSYLPKISHGLFPTVLLVDLTGNGLDDLLLGSFNTDNPNAGVAEAPSVIYLNPGNGDFSNVTPIIFNSQATYSIVPIHISSKSYADLVGISQIVNGTSNTLNILINDGTGHFTDQTASRVSGAPTTVANGWVNIYVADVNNDGAPDIVISNFLNLPPPSEIFFNDGSGNFHLAFSTHNEIVAVVPLNGTTNVIELNEPQNTLVMVPFTGLPILQHPITNQTWIAGQTVSFAVGPTCFTDPGGYALTYAGSGINGSALPSWLSFNAATDTFTGVAPSTFQSYSLTITATDANGWLTEANFTARIADSVSQAVAAFAARQISQPAPVYDSAANVAASLDQLQSIAAASELSSITLTDSGTPTLSISTSELASDAAALKAISGSFNIDILAPTTSATITGGIAGLGDKVVFNGASTGFTMTPTGDGHSLTVTEGSVTYTLKNVNALQFSDTTDIVASQTPPVPGAVNTAQVTELYSAVLARTPDVGGLSFYQNYAAANPSTPFLQFAEWFLGSSEYTSNSAHNYAQTVAGDQQFITDSYNNLLHRVPSTADINFYENNVIAPALAGLAPGSTAYAAADAQAHAQTLVYFSQSPEFLTDVTVTAQNPSSSAHWLVLI